MGLLDQVVGNMMGAQRRPQAKPGMGQTVAAGVLLALLVKAARQQRAGSAGSQADPGRAQGQAGGMFGGLGGLMGGGGGLGSILGSLGGAGALGGMIGRLQQRGLSDEVNSWVATGENKRVEPQKLEAALGDDTLDELQQQTGLSRPQLLAQLSEELPDAVNEATPEGRVPDDQDLERIAQAPARH